MSRNNGIAVAKIKNNKNGQSPYRYYVFVNLNMDTQFIPEYIKELINNRFNRYGNRKSTTNRGKALCLAHDIQKNIDTEYGVIEIDID